MAVYPTVYRYLPKCLLKTWAYHKEHQESSKESPFLGFFRFGIVEMLCITALVLWELCKRKTLREQKTGMDRTWCWAHLQSYGSCTMQIKLKPAIPAEWLFSVSWWRLSLILMRTVMLLVASCYCFFPVYFRHAECQVFYCLATVLRFLS